MNISTFKYSARLPLPAGTVSPEWLGPEFLATLESLTQIDSNIFPDWDVSELYAMKAYRLAAARSRISEIITSNVVRDDLDRPEPESGYHASAHTTTHTTSRQMTLWVCAVARRRFPVGVSPTRQPLPPEATGAVTEVTK